MASESDLCLLLARFHDVVCVISDRLGNTLIYRPFRGDRQGDGLAVERFICFWPIIAYWAACTIDNVDALQLSFWGDWSETFLTANRFFMPTT